MKAVLDHVGIAVEDVGAALDFFNAALGLEVTAPEEVGSQMVRARFVGVNRAIELLEPTAPHSVIARFLARRGPGLHHITLRVDDLAASLAELAARGVRLIDRAPRPGAEGALVAFIHPESTHGVLVELKQPRHRAVDLTVRSLSLGDLRLVSVHDGTFRLDGGAMFGVIPRVLWEPRAAADDRHRIQLAMRPLVIEAEWGRMIIDCGAGDKMGPRQQEIYAFDRTRHLDHALADAGLSASDIDVVLITHLHFDHAGGATARSDKGVVPRFPRARYVIRSAEWDDALHSHGRNRASYVLDDLLPLAAAGVIDFLDADAVVRPGVRVARTGGHTAQHQIVFLESGALTAVFAADLIPTTAHVDDAWIMGYDLFPVDTLTFKRAFVREAIDREYLIFFEHDPVVAAGYIRERGGQRYVEPAFTGPAAASG